MASGDVEYELNNLKVVKFNVDEGQSEQLTAVNFEMRDGSGTYDGAQLGAVVVTVSYNAVGTFTGSQTDPYDNKGGVNPFDPDKKYKITVTEV